MSVNYYPFTALVGQEEMKQALLLNLINPSLGGVCITGEKGTAKSTAVRALANVLEDLQVVTLPLSATEDRVVGTLNIEHALKHGEKKFEPGILAKANGHILYVDEINLLEDHIVDVLLDAAAMGVNTIERDGISYSHAAKFMLVGTMNPEEGELRPQLLDRFGLSTTVASEKDTTQRVEVMKRRLAFEENPEAFILHYLPMQQALFAQIQQAKKLLSAVSVSEVIYELVAQLSIALQIESHRADITMVKAAKTLAAFEGDLEVTARHIQAVAPLVYSHRLKQNPFEEEGKSLEEMYKIIEQHCVVSI